MTSPLTPTDCDLTDFPFMPLDVARLRDSELASNETPESCWAAVLIWAASWHQVPAASIPDDDKWLAKAAGYGRVIKEWLRVREGALRGFVPCDDGRLYHPVVAEKAREAWQSKLKHRWGSECARIKKHNERHHMSLVKPTFDEWVKAGCPQGQPLPVAGDKSPSPQSVTGETSSKRQGEGERQGQGEGERQGQGEGERQGQGEGESLKDSAPDGAGAAAPTAASPPPAAPPPAEQPAPPEPPEPPAPSPVPPPAHATSAAERRATPRAKITDPAEIIFGYGVPLLVQAGSAEKHARSFLGKLRSQHGDEKVVDALRNCLRAKPLQPLEWLAGALPPPAVEPDADREARRRAESDAEAMKLLGITGGARDEQTEVIDA